MHPHLQLRGDDRFSQVNWRRMFQLLITVVRQYIPGACHFPVEQTQFAPFRPVCHCIAICHFV